MSVIFAYIDPGTGSYLLQIALGGIFATGYAVRHFWSRIKQFLGRPPVSPSDDVN